MTLFVQIVWALIGVHALLGALLLLPMHLRILPAVDPATRGAGWFFRALITPGLIVFWPLLLLKSRHAAHGRETAGPLEKPLRARHQRKLHGAITLTLALALLPVTALAVLFHDHAPLSPNTLPAAVTVSSHDFPRVFQYVTRPFEDLPATLKIRANAANDLAVEVQLTAMLEDAPAVLYLQSGTDTKLRNDARFLGGLWGPATLTYPIQQTLDDASFTLIAWSFLRQEALGTVTCTNPAGSTR